MKNNFRHLLPAVLALTLCSVPALANQFGRLPLSEQIAKADVVIVGRASQPHKCSVEGRNVACLSVTDAVYLIGKDHVKGRKSISVVTFSRAEEASFVCCNKPGTYMFMLKEWQGNFFPVNGRWSLIKLSPEGGPDVISGDATLRAGSSREHER